MLCLTPRIIPRMNGRFFSSTFFLGPPKGGKPCPWIPGQFSFFFFFSVFPLAFRENFSMAGTVLSDGNLLPHETITGRITNGLTWKVLLPGAAG